MAITEQLYERQAALCFVGEEGRRGSCSGFPVLSIGTAQDVSFFLSFFFFSFLKKKKRFLGNAR